MQDDSSSGPPIAITGEVGSPIDVLHDRTGQPLQPAISTTSTVVPRYIAASIDNFAAMVLGFVAAKSVSDQLPALQVGLLVGTYLAYYFLFEGLFARTPGKFAAELVVVQYDGSRCTFSQAGIRTLLRVIEVNPILLGGLPAALLIIGSKYRQRLGDKAARTIVVHTRRLPRK